jgi:beta-1,2-mannobiose phosphorylase / 1,2-beta-oligomannan phosphorylase
MSVKSPIRVGNPPKGRADLAERFSQNPILSPEDLKPSAEGLEVACLLNPGAFRFLNKTWLLVRVAERPRQQEGKISFPILNEDGGVRVVELDRNDPDVRSDDPRMVSYRGQDYLTTLSHLRLFCSDDGVRFEEPEGYLPLAGLGRQESYGIEDCRVSQIGDVYHLTYTAVSPSGVGVGLRTTKDWRHFECHGMILPPHNKDCAIFEEKIDGRFFMLHRPSSLFVGGNYIWVASSPDGLHWGDHRCLLRTRSGHWDCARVGAGAAPIKTDRGWLEIYHGADENNRYCLGACLLDLNDPSRVLAVTDEPLMRPLETYELSGFFGHVVFTNGHVLDADGDTLTLYYGAADEFVCGARLSLGEIFSLLKTVDA